jgi:signal transduction histidine kinase
LEQVNLSEMLQNVMEDCEAQGGDRVIESDFPRNLIVKADGILLEQALQNLAINALKYSDTGGRIQIAVKSKNGKISIRVSNTGMSIPEVDREKIFERFYRVDRVRSRSAGGAGLGLSLSREIVRAHHGDLYLEESNSSQTVFVIELPV